MKRMAQTPIELTEAQQTALHNIAAKFGKDPSQVLDDLLSGWSLDMTELTDEEYYRGLQKTLHEWSSPEDAEAFDHL